jgi:formiminotetrahydrofolate cyclodeaminase
LKHATYVPLRILEACVAVLELTSEVIANGNPNVVSDGGAGVLAAHAGMMTAALNVRINLNAIKDETFVDESESLMNALLTRGDAAHQAAWTITSERLGM